MEKKNIDNNKRNSKYNNIKNKNNMQKFINIFVCKFLFHVKYFGLENLGNYNKFLICPNHSSIFDAFFIYPVSTNLNIMAKSELFNYKLLAKIFKKYNVFPVNRNTKDPKSLIHSLEIFNTTNHTELLIFPEGKVIKDENEIGKVAKKGPTFISAKLQIPIIPCYITRRPHIFSKVSVTFGKAIQMEESLLNNKKDLVCKSKELINSIYEIKDLN